MRVSTCNQLRGWLLARPSSLHPRSNPASLPSSLCLTGHQRRGLGPAGVCGVERAARRDCCGLPRDRQPQHLQLVCEGAGRVAEIRPWLVAASWGSACQHAAPSPASFLVPQAVGCQQTCRSCTRAQATLQGEHAHMAHGLCAKRLRNLLLHWHCRVNNMRTWRTDLAVNYPGAPQRALVHGGFF